MPASFTINFVKDSNVSDQDIDNVKDFFSSYFGKHRFDEKFNEIVNNEIDYSVRTLASSTTNADCIVIPGWYCPCLKDNHKPLPNSLIKKGP